MLAVRSYDRNNHPESDYITIAIDVHKAFLHADIDQELFAKPPEADECYESALCEDEVWKLNKVWLSQSTETVASKRCKSPGKSE